jgi:hypothetical protein
MFGNGLWLAEPQRSSRRDQVAAHLTATSIHLSGPSDKSLGRTHCGER